MTQLNYKLRWTRQELGFCKCGMSRWELTLLEVDGVENTYLRFKVCMFCSRSYVLS